MSESANKPEKPPGQQQAGQAEWTQQRERGFVSIVRFMAWLSLRLGRTASRVILHGIAVYFLLFSPKARQALQQFYRQLQKRPANWRQLHRHFLTFASTIHDRVFFLNDQLHLFHIDIVGREELERALAGGRGLLIMGAHMGSFEALRAIGTAHQRTAHMLMYEENAGQINAILAAINPAAPRNIIALNRMDSMLTARQKLLEGDMLGVLADRTFGREGVVQLPFFGRLAEFPTGPLRLAVMLGAQVVFMAGIYLGGNRYQVRIHVLGDFADCPRAERSARVQETQQRYIETLQNLCRNYPHNWFNFFPFWPAQGPAAETPRSTA